MTTERVSTTDTIGQALALDNEYHFRKILIDDGGLGGPILDSMTKLFGRRVMGLNNSSRRIQLDSETERKKGILKEDLYINTLMLLETGLLEMIADEKLLRSMRSITYGHGEEDGSRKIRIWGDYSHLTEALVRACWCIKERGLELYAF